jgi:GDP-4-dehydro-6-deoxy-D-mannose reductase
VRALITGIGGFVGGHLARQLLNNGGCEIVGTVLFGHELSHPIGREGVELRQVDLTDGEAVLRLLREIQPDQIYHLAAQAFVPISFDNPWATLSNNISSQLHLLYGIAKLDLDTRILVVGSGEEYGLIRPEDNPVDENQPLRPASPYSVSKVAQDMLGLQYYLSHDVAAIRVRPFNQIGPGQSTDFVAPAFAHQIAAIEKSLQEPVMHVGNLEAKRDFTDVRDMARAYMLLLESGTPGEVYNAGSGEAHSIQQLLETLLHLSDAPIEVRFDPSRARPIDVPIVVCDASKLCATTGWKPEYSFEQSLADVLADMRTRIGVSAQS